MEGGKNGLFWNEQFKGETETNRTSVRTGSCPTFKPMRISQIKNKCQSLFNTMSYISARILNMVQT